jgi:hypothetical protein
VPKNGEKYWVPSSISEDSVFDCVWKNDGSDNLFLYRNFVCRTEEEAKEKLDKMMKAIEE